MHSQSNQPCRRARFLSALKLSDKPNKAVGISSSNFKRAKAYEMAHPKPVVKPTLDLCDPLLVALARSANTSTSNRYALQRSTKIPVRVPAGFPVNQNFSQRVLCTFDDVNNETDEVVADEDEDLDQSDPMLAALARSANNATSRRYASQRSTKVPIRVPAGFPVNQNFSQKVIHPFETVKTKVEVAGPSADKDVISSSQHGKSKGIDFPRSEMHKSQNDADLVDWSISTPVRVPRKHRQTLPSKVSSTFFTPGLTVSSSPATSSVVSPIGCSSKMPTSTPSSRRIVSTGPSSATPRWLSKTQPTPTHKEKLYTIHEALLSPFGLPSSAPEVIHGGKTHAEVLAGLEFLNKFYSEM
ncbi:uncharacterized protein MELLADRAFT_108938 [Melampsora larici-populina 98AG31]|uniref:Uncharacterized protein n=1 Tax=Melampsora larici-populina (strain 98AG31 / pathotype 3-4-7) TaxID=747676 RepID=F4RUT4_MELLP|nr:uncharacterized protein MELLADRAFT_108938 [Melampsora larici-populina 98AG31]EGG03869.1 hypothetical protein MELLADRAFT_108938 [Melampsora larici-populina 98AG31]